MEDTISIKVSDFGESFSSTGPLPKRLHTPIRMLPPESIFEEELGPSADIWTLACTLFEIMADRSLFEPPKQDSDYMLADMIQTLGPLPERWWKTWQNRRSHYLDDGSPNPDSEGPWAPVNMTLEERIAPIRLASPGLVADGSKNISPWERASLKELLESMLKYEPSKRITALQALESDYMQNWAGDVDERSGSSTSPLAVESD
jgi:serine/threonine-protein kinase SRPK3